MPQYASISTPSIIIPTLLLLLIIITCKSHELIGFIYGPSSQLFATKQQIIQANLLSRILSNNEATTTTTTTITTTVTSWMARIATTAEQIYNPHYELAYQHDCKTCILHDAGVIAALFAILHACNFFGDTISKRQQQQQQQQQRRRFHYFFMAGALFILPGMIGQLLISKTIPIEIVLLNRFNTDTSLSGMLESLLYVGYCSWKSVLDHHYDGVYRIVAMGNAMYELKVVGVALALVAFFLG